MTDYRALCVELLDALENAIRVIYHEDGTKHISTADTVIAKADAALARPEPQGATDAAIEEAAKLIHASMRFAVPDNHYTRDWVERGNSLMQDEARRTARAVLARWGRPAIAPIPVSERLPEVGKKVIAHYVNSLGNSRTVCAEWVPAKSRTDDCLVEADDGFAEYDEKNGEYYWPEGWYESIENWDEYGAVFINDVVTHWQPLPNGPASARPLSEGGAA